MLAEKGPQVPLRPEPRAAHYPDGRAVLSGPHRGAVGRGRGGGMATSGEPVGSGGWGSTRSALRSRAIASLGYLPGHADFARHLALVVNELLTAGALPPNGPAAEVRVTLHLLRRPFDKS